MDRKELDKLATYTVEELFQYENDVLLKEIFDKEERDNKRKEFREVLVYFKLGIKGKDLEDLINGNTNRMEFLKSHLKNMEQEECRKKEKVRLLRKLCKKKDKIDKFIDECLDEICFVEREDAYGFEKDCKKIGSPSLTSVFFSTMIFLGPILWLFIDLHTQNYDVLSILVPLSLLSTVFLTISWSNFIRNFKQREESFGHAVINLVVTLLMVLVVLTLTLFLFWGIDGMQQYFFVPKNFICYVYKKQYRWIPFLIEAELIIAFFMILAKFKVFAWDWTTNFARVARKYWYITVGLNLFFIYMASTSVVVATEVGIKDYSFYNLRGTEYPYSDAVTVNTGFAIKGIDTLKIKKQSNFYYQVTFKNGKTIEFPDATGSQEVTYMEYVTLDNLIMQYATQKISSTENASNADLDDIYLERLVRVINNK